MLRIGYLPSDFNPMVLMLGDAEDFRALAGVLRAFARHPVDVRLDRLAFCQPHRVGLTIRPCDQGSGVVPNDRADGTIVWRVAPDAAAIFADRADDLSHPSRVAGSELLDLGLEDSITVKISRGEYTDDFLTGTD